MKINAVMNIIKKSASIFCGVVDGVQWISAGGVCYNINPLPELNEEQVIAMMGVSGKKSAEYTVDFLPETIRRLLDKSAHTEKILDRGMITLCIGGNEYEPVIINNRVYFIDVRYYKPFDGVEWDISAWVDKASGEVSIAVKAGFLVLGYIAPTNVKTDFIAMDLALLTETLKRQKEYEAALVEDFEEDGEEY